MKKIVFIILLSVFVGPLPMPSVAKAQANTCPAIAPVLCADGTCSNSAAACSSAGAGGPAVTTTSGTGGTTSVNGDPISGATRCTGDITFNQTAAEACADLAESQGKALGWDITCAVVTGSANGTLNGVHGLVTTYNGGCTVHGIGAPVSPSLPGAFTPYALAGYQGNGTGYPHYDYSDRLFYVWGGSISPTWSILGCTLVDLADGRAGGGVLVGWSTCPTATQAQGMVDSLKAGKGIPGVVPPVTTNTNTTTNNTTNTNTTTGTNTTTSGVVTGTRIPSAYTNQLTVILNNLLATARALYGSAAVNARNNPGGNVILSSTFDVKTDKTSYCVGETPLYTITGSANAVGSKIFWTSYLDNAITSEIRSDYGATLTSKNGLSFWSNYGGTWNSSQIGHWRKDAIINNITKSAYFDVKDCGSSTVPPPSTAPQIVCSPKTQTVSPYSVTYVTAWTGLQNFDWSGTYNWSSPGATKTSGQGVNYSTSYSSAGTYTTTLTSGGKSDTCTTIVTS